MKRGPAPNVAPGDPAIIRLRSLAHHALECRARLRHLPRNR